MPDQTQETQTLEIFSFVQPLIELNRQRYLEAGKSPEMADQLVEHVKQVVNLTQQAAKLGHLSETETRCALVAASLHDIAKVDSIKAYNHLPTYSLVAHHDLAADQIEKDFSQFDPDGKIISWILNGLADKKSRQKIIKTTAFAVRTHMGPNPGFMADTLAAVNAELDKKNQITHPKPSDYQKYHLDQSAQKIAEALLVADMISLLSPDGVQKVIKLRQSGPHFVKEDQDKSQEFAQYKINLSVGQAAFLSAIKSANQAQAMINALDNKEYSQLAASYITAAKQTAYHYHDQEISAPDTLELNDRFNVFESAASKLGKEKWHRAFQTILKFAPQITQSPGLSKELEEKIAQALKAQGVTLSQVLPIRTWEELPQT